MKFAILPVCLLMLKLTKSQFILAIRSVIYKQTTVNAKDAETMNKYVEEMVRQAITCNGVENIVNAQDAEDIFSEDFEKQLERCENANDQIQCLNKTSQKGY